MAEIFPTELLVTTPEVLMITSVPLINRALLLTVACAKD